MDKHHNGADVYNMNFDENKKAEVNWERQSDVKQSSQFGSKTDKKYVYQNSFEK